MDTVVLLLALSGPGNHEICCRPKPVCCEVRETCCERRHSVRHLVRRVFLRCCPPVTSANGYSETTGDDTGRAPAPAPMPAPAPAPAPAPTPPPEP